MSRPLLVRALCGESTERRPLWIMRQAGRYLPEYRALRRQHSFLELSNSAELSAEVTLQPLRRFDLDAAIIFADIMSPMEALGVEVDFAPGPVIEKPIATAADVEVLADPDPEAIAPQVIDALRRVRAELPTEVGVIGFCGAPLTLAAYLVQGHGKSDFPKLRALATSDPSTFTSLLEKLARLVAKFLERQVAAGGAQAVQIFDSWAGLLSLADWRRLVKPVLRDLLQELGTLDVPRVLFLHNAAQILDDVTRSASSTTSEEHLPYEALAVDWRQDLAAIRAALPADRAVQGNLDPAVLLAGPEAVREAAKNLLERVPRRGHVVNLGHGIMPQAPIDSVHALVDVVRSESQP
ncbi:MAG: uroporphyrinogen decarboxylase [Thermoanaerobaculia bacterium]|nr:uroporphyrinogen decarboxylase [Thermoanaerobaculia bacterium]